MDNPPSANTRSAGANQPHRPGDKRLASDWKHTLQAADDGWRALVMSAPQVVAIADLAGRVQFLNHTIRQPDVASVIGREMDELVHPDDQPAFRRCLERVRETGEATTLRLRGFRVDGTPNWYQLSIGPLWRNEVLDGYIVNAADIDEAKRTEDALRESRRVLARAQQIAHVGSWTWDVRRDHERWSDELYRIYQVDPATHDFTLEGFLKLVHPDDRAAVRRRVRRALESGRAYTSQHRVMRPDGTSRIIFSRVEVLKDADARPTMFSGVSQDITELTEAYEELARRTEELHRMEELDQLKTNFVHSVSHELRTPLTSILGFAEFLEDGLGGPLTDTQAEYVTEIETGVKRLERLVDDLLDFARIEAGTFKLQCQEADLADKAREVVASLQPQARGSRLSLTLVAPAGPIPLVMDAHRVGQVLINLINNAIKFTPAEGRVTVAVAREGEFWRLTVSDTGLGIAQEDIPKLFHRFSQLDNAQRKGGSGLGLSISKVLVEAHHGHIGVTSTPGEGATFWFTLPAEGAACDAP